MPEKILDSSDGAVILEPTRREHRVEAWIAPTDPRIRALRFKPLGLREFIASNRFDALHRGDDIILISVHMYGSDDQWNRKTLDAQSQALAAAAAKRVPMCFVFVRSPTNQPAEPMGPAAIRAELPGKLRRAIARYPAGLISGHFTIGTSSALRATTVQGGGTLGARLGRDDQRQRRRYAIVIGQDRDICVAATIFGDPNPRDSNRSNPSKCDGLLDLNIRVITSFDVLHGSGTPLDYYRLEMTDMTLGAGAAVRSARDAATRAPTKAALNWCGGRG